MKIEGKGVICVGRLAFGTRQIPFSSQGTLGIWVLWKEPESNP
ncbi:MAG: hypothetical protein QHG99_06315 [Methanomicrobiales archaeon]|nr:hypothetical protein [Methanomicrobiales archaeon]